MVTKIIGTGRYLPKQVVTNDDLAKIMDTSDEWIRTRTGIRERHLVKDETTSQMSYEAAKRALEASGLSAKDIDLIIVGTITSDCITPSTACEVQALLGADNAMAFDVNAACTGFMVAFNTAHVYLQAGIYKNAIVIGAETLSKIMDWNDRSTCVLFGDGAGAAVITSEDTDQGMYAFHQMAVGAKGSVLAGRSRLNNNPLVSNSKELEYITMDGQEVYKFAVSTVPKCIQKVLDDAGVDISEVKYFILHQANIRIIESVAKRLKVDEAKLPISLDHCGNISAASVPILLDEVNEKGLLQKGDKVVMAGFGAGLTYSACVFEW